MHLCHSNGRREVGKDGSENPLSNEYIFEEDATKEGKRISSESLEEKQFEQQKAMAGRRTESG